MFRILQTPVVENYPYNALEIFGIQILVVSQFSVVKETDFIRLACNKKEGKKSLAQLSLECSY